MAARSSIFLCKVCLSSEARKAFSNKDTLKKAEAAETILLTFQRLAGPGLHVGALAVELAAIVLDKKKFRNHELMEVAAVEALAELNLKGEAPAGWIKAVVDFEKKKPSTATSSASTELAMRLATHKSLKF